MRSRSSMALAAALALVLAVPARAEDVPARNQAVLMLRVLLYDRALATRIGSKTARVVVVSDPVDHESRAAGEAMLDALKQLSSNAVLGGRKIEPIAATPDTLPAVLTGAAAVYVAPGASLAKVRPLAAQEKVLTFASDRRAVADGACVGFVVRSGRAAILVNLASARATGADFEAGFLELVELL